MSRLFGALPAIWRWPASGLALLACAGLSYTRADADLWGHLRFGLDLLRDHRLPTVDPYSFTQDATWINHEWLSELQTALAYQAAGVVGLSLLKMVLASAAFYLVWSALAGVRLNLRLGAMLGVFASTIHITSSLRPQAWTFLFLTILVRTLTIGSVRPRRWLPLLFVIWANCHGGWIVGFGVLTVWTFGEFAESRRIDLQRCLVVLLALLATLVTPYGVQLWMFVLTTVRMQRSIAEWQPVWTAGPPNWLPWLAAVAVTIWAVRHLRAQRLARLLVLAMLAYASFRVLRIGSLFVEVLVLLVAPVLASRWPARALPEAKTAAERVVAKAMFTAATIAAVFVFRWTLSCMPIEGRWQPDTVIGHSLDAAQRGRIVTYFDWGQYALWHVSPRLRVSMDGRRETIYSERRLREHDAIVDGSAEGLATLAAWRAEYVWLPARSAATRDWLQANGYRIDLETVRSFLAVRADLPLISTPSVSTRSHKCFPG